jgi:3-methyladenine DNA glycosylase AlkD
MDTVAEVMTELESLGTEQTRRTFARHGAPLDRMFGVKVGDLKTVLKKIKGKQALALELYATGNSDAMYLAGLVANGAAMTKKQLDTWAKEASWYMISEFTVPWVAAEHSEASKIAIKWIQSKDAKIASSGWATYSSLVSYQPDSRLDLDEIESLLQKVGEQVHNVSDRVAYTMNNFVICVGCYVTPLASAAKKLAQKIGVVHVDVGDTSCKVPIASEAIAKVEASGRIGQKRKNLKC